MIAMQVVLDLKVLREGPVSIFSNGTFNGALLVQVVILRYATPAASIGGLFLTIF